MIHRKIYPSDFDNLRISECDESVVNEFLEIINSETLGKKVTNALNHREQGHFNKAILNISEANRDQVLAIREIQAILDELKGKVKTKVIFDKYRQTLPFQIGLTNGNEVLNLLTQIKSFCGGGFQKIISELHQNEVKVSSLNEELTFFEERMKGKIPGKELDEIRRKISSLANKINSTKTKIIDNLSNFIEKEFHSANPNVKLKLIRNFFMIITSSIETLDAKLVEV